MPAFLGGEVEDSQEIGLEIRNMQHTFKLNNSGLLPFKDRFKLYRAYTCRVDNPPIGNRYRSDIWSVCFEPMSVRCHVGSCTSVTVPEFRVCSRRGRENRVSSKFFDHISNRRSSHLCLCPLPPPLFALLLCLLSCSRLCCKVKFTNLLNMARLGAEGASCCRWRRR